MVFHMAMTSRGSWLLPRAGVVGALAALLLAAACGGDKQTDKTKTVPEAADSERAETARPESEASERNKRVPVPESPTKTSKEALRQEGYYRLSWSGDSICEAVVEAMTLNHATADMQARTLLGTSDNVEWVQKSEGVQAATLDYFDDATSRQMERRNGMLSGNRIITLWVGDADGDFARLDYGHAGANTSGFPDYQNLHTKLTYSVADIIAINGRHLTLVAPLTDFAPSGAVFAIAWKTKDGAAQPYAPQDYYPTVSCVMTPSKAEE